MRSGPPDPSAARTPEELVVTVEEERLSDTQIVRTTRECLDDGTLVFERVDYIGEDPENPEDKWSTIDGDALHTILDVIVALDRQAEPEGATSKRIDRAARERLRQARKAVRKRLARFIREWGVADEEFLEVENPERRQILMHTLARENSAAVCVSVSLDDVQFVGDDASRREASLRPIVVTKATEGCRRLYHQARRAFIAGLFDLTAAGARAVMEDLVNVLARRLGGEPRATGPCGPTLQEKIAALRVPDDLKAHLEKLRKLGNQALHGATKLGEQEARDALLLLHQIRG